MAADLMTEMKARRERDVSLIAAVGRTSLDDIRSSWELDVINDVEHGRWGAILNEDAVAELPYRVVGGRVVLLSA